MSDPIITRLHLPIAPAGKECRYRNLPRFGAKKGR
jgi:hypothetical protein